MRIPLLLSTLPIVDGAKVGYNLGNYTNPDRNNFAPSRWDSCLEAVE